MAQKVEISVLIVEDNPVIAEDLAANVVDFGYKCVGTAINADEALKILRNNHVDLVLLDVGLDGEIDGIELANIIRSKYDVPFIFLTAFYDEKTIGRIKATRPDAYLVKPIDEHSLKTSMEVALYNFQHRHDEMRDTGQLQDGVEDDHFFVKVKQGLLKIHMQDLLFFEAYDNYSYLYTGDSKHLLSLSLKQVEDKLPAKQFIRVHRSFIVNIHKIDRIDEMYLYIGAHNIPIGKTYRSEIMSQIKLL